MDNLYETGLEKPLLELCPICMDNDQFTYKSWIKLKRCSHCFHRHCIDLWLEKKDNCPVCIQNVYNNDKIIDIDNSNNSNSNSNSDRYICARYMIGFLVICLFSIFVMSIVLLCIR